MTYAEKLLDPRWQRKRLEVLNRADFACDNCGATDKTLHVHHGYYAKDRDPWDYEMDTLHALCKICHDNTTETMKEIRHRLGRHQGSGDLDMILGMLRALDASENPEQSFPYSSPEHASGMAAVYDLSERQLTEWCVLNRPKHLNGYILALIRDEYRARSFLEYLRNHGIDYRFDNGALVVPELSTMPESNEKQWIGYRVGDINNMMPTFRQSAAFADLLDS